MSNLSQIFGDGFDGYKRYLKRKFSTLNDFEAEDIIQQTAMKFIYKGGDLAAIHQISAYIKTSLSNTAKDYFKKQDREVPSEMDEENGGITDGDILLETEMKQALKAAILKLDEKSRFVFVETVIRGTDYKTLSEKTGEPIGTLLARKKRAVVKLKKIMSEYFDDEGEQDNE